MLLSMTLSLSAGCSLMDIEQKSKITSSNMWLNESDAEGAMYGMFHQFRGTYATALIYWGDYRSGTFGYGLGSGTAYDKMYKNQLDATESKGTNWGSIYTLVNDANLILRHVPEIEFSSQDEKNEILANAYFVRAFAYFSIARVWGDAPKLTTGFESTEADLKPSRTDVSEIYALIEDDIDNAYSLMPDSAGDCTTANKAAVNMLKAEFYLWLYGVRNGGEAALEAAETAVDEVLSSGKDILPSYADVFALNNKNNNEIIFTFHYAKDEFEGGYHSNYLIPTSRWMGSEEDKKNVQLMTADDQRCNFSETMVELLKSDTRDSRTSVSYGDWTDAKDGTRYTWVNKFAGLWEDNQRYFISDIPVYRFAEALMFKAEICMYRENLGDAVVYLNKVAKRAYGIDDYYSATTAADFKNDLISEYVKEFAAEGKTWWNYIRLGRAFTDIPSLRGRQNETNILLWPIATACMNENPNIRQTVGYN